MAELPAQRESRRGTRQAPVIVFVEPRVLIQTCVFRLLKKEIARYEVWGFETVAEVVRAAGRDVRLIAIDIGGEPPAAMSATHDFAALRDTFPQTPIAVISDRDDEASLQEAMQCGLRGFFPTSIPVDVMIAGFRLLLAGGVYCPPLIMPRHESPRGIAEPSMPIDLPRLRSRPKINGAHSETDDRLAVSFTPRERNVLEEMQLGHSNKVIARNLGLSENTVKMHVQHVMRKLGARTRTEAVFIWSRGASVASRSAWATPQ